MLPLASRNGFTLSELLVALGIIGLIAVFTLPKVLESSSSTQKRAIFKETLATLKSINMEGTAEGTLENLNIGDYYASKLNAAKVCTANPEANGCWHSTSPCYASHKTQANGFVLHNGAMITSVNNNIHPSNQVSIDWNGAQGPNIEGDDILCLYIYVSPHAKAGKQDVETTSAANQALWDELYAGN